MVYQVINGLLDIIQDRCKLPCKEKSLVLTQTLGPHSKNNNISWEGGQKIQWKISSANQKEDIITKTGHCNRCTLQKKNCQTVSKDLAFEINNLLVILD